MKYLLLVSIAGQLVLTAAIANGQTPPVKAPELREELVRRAKLDQDVRMEVNAWMLKQRVAVDFDPKRLPAEQQREFDSLTERWNEVDRTNTKWLDQLVKEQGWPTNSMVGKDGSKAAWLLVQHADANVTFQRKCLELMAKLDKEEVSPGDVAYLTDRVLLAEGKQQRYGTQFTIKDGVLAARPIEDEAGLEERRKTVGLPPMAEYIRQLKKVYGHTDKE